MSVQGNSNIVGGLHLDSEGEVEFSSDENGTIPTLNVDGEIELNGTLTVELAEGVALEDVPNLNLIESTDPTPTGTVNLVIQDSEGTEVAVIEDVQVDTLAEGKLSVCHKRGNSGKEKTLSIDSSSLGDHLSHGDGLGECSI